MPKLNARENTRNRSNAKKRLRNRALRATLKAAPAPPAAKAKSKANESNSRRKVISAIVPQAHLF